MSEAEAKAYKYAIPLGDEGGTEAPTYSVPDMNQCLEVTYGSSHYVVVVEDAIPHLHKDSVNVGVSEVPIREYTEGTPEGGDE